MGPLGREDEMKALWNQFRRDESGQSLVEYGLVIALVALAVIGALVIFKDKIAAVFTRMGNTLDTVG
jgi:pilus assembly protein Flp/PilA